jgi:hypothetical protein
MIKGKRSDAAVIAPLLKRIANRVRFMGPICLICGPVFHGRCKDKHIRMDYTLSRLTTGKHYYRCSKCGSTANVDADGQVHHGGGKVGA